MSLSSQQKTNLGNYLVTIEEQFNQLVGVKTYMFVCFTELNKPITYSGDTTEFASPIRVGKHTITLACVYNTQQDFNSQTNAFLS